jgi:hypothetical protein
MGFILLKRISIGSVSFLQKIDAGAPGNRNWYAHRYCQLSSDAGTTESLIVACEEALHTAVTKENSIDRYSDIHKI